MFPNILHFPHWAAFPNKSSHFRQKRKMRKVRTPVSSPPQSVGEIEAAQAIALWNQPGTLHNNLYQPKGVKSDGDTDEPECTRLNQTKSVYKPELPERRLLTEERNHRNQE